MSKNYIQKNRRNYDKIAAKFSDKRQQVWDLEFLREHVKNGETILDLGCGNGRLYQLFDKNQLTYIGIDQSKKLINIARKQVSEGNFFVADMRELSLEDQVVDKIFCIATFHHLPNKESRVDALEEMQRVLNPGGKIIMTNWNTESDWFQDKVKSGDYKQDRNDSEHFIVPFKNEDQEQIGERHYWKINKQILQNLTDQLGLKIASQKYINQQGEGTPKSQGMNLLSVFTK
jgi:ubiquinone/menaquinone biosynthesis C-methylase UbiE